MTGVMGSTGAINERCCESVLTADLLEPSRSQYSGVSGAGSG
jgi:hypothetical protein